MSWHPCCANAIVWLNVCISSKTERKKINDEIAMIEIFRYSMCAADWKCEQNEKKWYFFGSNSRIERVRTKKRASFGMKWLAQPPIQPNQTKPNQTKPLQSKVMALQSAHEINAGIGRKDENLQSFVCSFVYEYVKRIYMALLLILLFDNGNGCLSWFDFIENWGNGGVCMQSQCQTIYMLWQCKCGTFYSYEIRNMHTHYTH